MELKEAKLKIARAEKIICGLLNELEAQIGGRLDNVDTSIREVSEAGKAIPYVKINFYLDTK